MGRPRILAVILATLFISQLAAAEVHHENYDEARTDLLALVYYLQSSFEVLNDTLVSVREYDIDEAMESGNEFSAMVIKARETLGRIPKEVDSYEPLNLSVGLLGYIDTHLDDLVFGFEGNLLAVQDLNDYNFDHWIVSSVKENLSKADSALISFEEGLLSMESGRTEIMKDLEKFRDFDWTRIDKDLKGVDLKIDPKLDLLEAISENIEVLRDNSSTIEDVMIKLMKTPVSSWDSELRNLILESSPGNHLNYDVDIISAIDEDLSSEMNIVLDQRRSSLSEAENSTTRFRFNQTVFLKNITKLEASVSKSPSERITRFDHCFDSLEGMETELRISREVLSQLHNYDNGTIYHDLEELEDLLKRYAERLDRIEIWVPDLQSIIDGINDTLWENVLEADKDVNGELENDEVFILSLSDKPGNILISTKKELEDVRKELSLMPADYFPEVTSTLPLVEECLLRVEGFTTNHEKIIDSMKILAEEITRNKMELQMELFRALGYLSRLGNYLAGTLELTHSLNRKNLVLSNEWHGPLENLLDLYEGFLLSMEELLDGPTMYLSLDRDTIPYDLSIGYALIVLDIDLEEGPFLPDSGEADLILDGASYDTVHLKDGTAQGRIQIERSMSLGSHILNASYVSGTGSMIFSEDEFDVRKLTTTLVVEPRTRVLDPGSKGRFHFEVKDELFRTLDAEISVDEGRYRFETPSNNTLGPYPLGSNLVEALFGGNDHFQASARTFQIDVVQDPILKISSDRISHGRDDFVNITAELIRGNGSVAYHFDNISFPAGPIGEGEISSISIDPSILRNGTFIVKGKLNSSETWTRDGWSNVIYIIVDLSVQVIDDDPADDDQDDDDQTDDEMPSDDDDDQTDDDEKENPFWDPPGPIGPVDGNLLYWLLFLLLITAVSSVGLFFMIKNRKRMYKKRTDQKGRIHFPSLYTGIHSRTPKKIENNNEASSVRPLVSRTVVPLDRDRERMIKYYLEVIESSPQDFGITPSMTPREVSNALEKKGLDPQLAGRISQDFEWSIYKLGRPEKEILERFGQDRVTVKGWFSTLLEKLGIANKAGSKEVSS